LIDDVQELQQQVENACNINKKYIAAIIFNFIIEITNFTIKLKYKEILIKIEKIKIFNYLITYFI